MKIDSDFYFKLGKKIRSFRKYKKITQRELALKLKISHQQLHKYETGENKISSSKLFMICNVLQVEINYFFLENERLEKIKILQTFHKLNSDSKSALIKLLDVI